MNADRNVGSKWLLPRLLSVMAVLVGAVVVADTALQPGSASAAAINVGTLSAQLTDHVGTTQAGLPTGTSGNCVRYSPTNTSTSSALVTTPNEAITAHGYPSNGNCPSSLDITKQSAVGVRPAAGGSVVDGTPFLLGRVVHYNNPITSNVDQFWTGKLAVKLSGFDGAPTVGFNWWLWETPNSADPCPGSTSSNGCDDEIKFTDQISSTTVTQAGITYRLVVNGFQPVANGTACPASPSGSSQNDFWTKEQAQTHACLYATLVQVRKVTVVKKIVGATGVTTAPSKTFSFSGSGSLAGSPWTGKSFDLTPLANGTASTSTATEILRGDVAQITEGNPNDDRWALTSLACTDIGANGQSRALPSGATYNLATRTITLSNVPAPDNSALPDITCTYTNTYTPKATLTLVKQVSGGSALPSAFTLTATGAPGAPVNGATVSGVSGNAAVTSQRVPAGAYTLTENGPAGYLSAAGWSCTGASNSGPSLTLTDGASATCTIINRFQSGSLTIVKVLDAPSGAVSTNKTYSGTYKCGTASAVNFTVTTSTPFVATGLPAGVSCTVTETQPSGNLANGSYSWGAPTYSTQPVVIPDQGTATVTVTNHVNQATGTFSIVKAVSGPGGYTGGTARLFPVSYSCAIGGTVTATGSLNISTGGAVSASGPIPVSSVCTFTETLAAKPGDFADASYKWTGNSISPTTVTIAAGSPVAVTLTNTYVRMFGSLKISKLIDGNGYQGGSAKKFTVNYDCGGTFAGSVTLADNGNATVNGLPAGATCTLSETAPADNLLSAAYDWGVPTWSTNNTPVIVDGSTVNRTVTNHTVAVFGKVSVTKAVTGAAGGLLAGTTFRVTVACGAAGTTSFDLVLGVAQSTGNLPVGTECDVTETAPTGGLVDASYAWGTTPGSQHVVIASSNTTVAVTVTNTITRVYGGLSITKQVSAPAGVVAANRSFAGTYSCVYGATAPVTGSWNLQSGQTFTAPANTILLGSVCEVKENASAITSPPNATDPSYVWTGLPATQSVSVTSSVPRPSVTVTNVVTRLSGSIGVAKIVTGDGKAGGYVPSSTFPFDFTCAPALDSSSVSGSFSLADGAAWAGPTVPAGATCTVTEGTNPGVADSDYSWDGVTFSGTVLFTPNGRSVTFTTPLAGSPVQITATNQITRKTGPIFVTKVVTGETDGLLAGTNFQITLVCSDQVARSAQVANGLAHKFSGIPVGVTCTASETLPTAPLLDASFAWGTPSYSPTAAVGVDGRITVDNPITRVVAPVSLTKTFTGPQGVVSADTNYTGTWACDYRGVQIAGGNWSATVGQTVQLAASVPLTSVCSATEDALGVPSADPSYRWLAPAFTPAVVTGGSNVVTVANTLTRDTGSITVTKELAGATSGYTGQGAAFTVRYKCAVVGQPAVQPLQNTVALAAGASAQITGIPLGWTCALTEDSPSAALLADGSFTWATPSIDHPSVTLSTGVPAASVTVTNPIERVFGTLQIVKTVSDGFGAVLPSAEFSGNYSCTYGTEDPVTGSWTITGAAGGTASVSTPFLIGSKCSVTENAPSAAALKNASYAWDAPVLGDDVTVAGPAPVSLEVTNSVHRLYGGLSVTKSVVDPAHGVRPTAVFAGMWTCALGEAPAISERFQVSAGQTLTLFTAAAAKVPAASTCSIVEDTPDPAGLVDGSFAWAAPVYDPADVVLVDGQTVGLGVTNSVTRVSSSLEISKSVTGPAASLVDPDRVYAGTVSCTYGSDEPVVRSWEATTSAPAVVDGILVGSTCAVTESVDTTSAPPVAIDPSYVWEAPVITPLSAVVAAPNSAVASVEVENPTARRTASFSVDKAVTGATEGIVGPAPLYHFRYECTPATGDPIGGSFQMAADGSWTSDADVPVGSMCTVLEPVDALPTLVDSAWSWDEPIFLVDGADAGVIDRGVEFMMPVNGEVDVVVHTTNNVSRAFGSFSVAKTSNPTSGSTVVPGSTITYTVTVTSTGDVPVHDVVVTDDLLDVAPHAEVGPVFAADQGTVDYDALAGTITWDVGDVAPGATLTLSYTARVHDDAKNVVVRNAVFATGDVPPTTCSEPDPTCTTEHYTPEWTVAKASDPASGSVVVPGQVVTYTLTAFNLSTTADAAGIVVTDHLADVLDDATLTTDLAPLGAQLTGSTLTWNVGTLAPGASATLTYRVTVKATAFGATLVNLITADGATDPNQCAVGAEPSQGCSTTHRSPLAPTIVKRLVGEPTVAADGVTNTVKYQIVVTNPNSADVVSYDLADTLGLPAGVTVRSATVTSSPAGVTVNAGWNGRTNTGIVTGASLAASATHTYEVTVVAEVPVAVSSALRACTGTAGNGFFNGATLVAFGSTSAVSACGVIAAAQESGAPVPTTAPPTTAVRPSGSLPTTGSDLSRLLQAAGVPLLLGLLMLAMRRRQRPA